ncbi:ABC transporter ATP-binding protein [Cupriavidus sp. IDO]|uniref:ABC transporter ATP-binding protein n=1 Tax=Cupriavidus sp. IDO TaxID=1539142 RepID=UPI000B1878F5|nr:ABC transporter ATP-binding protein [Cupriavidus sp. IDO]
MNVDATTARAAAAPQGRPVSGKGAAAGAGVPPLLETRGLTIRFGGHVAVNAVSCAFRPGELTCIVGPNGAGKTTYFNLISGQLPPTAGQILLDGEDVTRLPVSQKTRRGIGRAFQLTSLFPNLSVLENVRLAVQARQQRGVDLFSMWTSHRDVRAQAQACLERVALADKRHLPVASLPHGDQRKLEVGILLALQPRIFMFDEPTAGMSVDEVPVILDLIQEIRQDRSKTVLLVEHKMDVVRSLADRIIVLHNGTLMADGNPAEVIASPIVQQAYLGTMESDTEASHG